MTPGRKKRLIIFIIITSREIILRFLTPWSQMSGVDTIELQESELTEQQQGWVRQIQGIAPAPGDPQRIDITCCEENSVLQAIKDANVYEIELRPVQASENSWGVTTCGEGDLDGAVVAGCNGLAELAA